MPDDDDSLPADCRDVRPPPAQEAPVRELAEILRDPAVGVDPGVTLLAVRRLVATLRERPLQPALQGALMLVADAAEVATVMALSSALGSITKNDLGRAVVEARMALSGVPAKPGTHGAHWQNALRVLVRVWPLFMQAPDDAARRHVADLTARRIEEHVGRRPRVGLTQLALTVLHHTQKPKKGQHPRARVLRVLFRDLRMKTKTEEDRAWSTFLSRTLDEILSEPGAFDPRRPKHDPESGSGSCPDGSLPPDG